jgi:hypothetical protein
MAWVALIPRNRSGGTGTVEDWPPKGAALLARAKRGELDAYDEIVRMHGMVAFRTGSIITASAANAEDGAEQS